MRVSFAALTRASSLVVAAAAPVMDCAFAQTQPPAWTPPRLADGRPDLQGVWDYRTITPFERPVELGTKEFFTAEEAAAFEAAENQRQNRDLIDPEQGGLNYPPGGVVPYNEFWYDRGNSLGGRRTSLIVDPPNGRLPPWTAEGQRLADERAARSREDQLGHPRADTWEDRPLQERCIVGLNQGPPMTPGAYNNNFQIVQTPGYVVIVNEMVHSARIVPMDGRPHDTVRQWKGDSRGSWEGDTLVVDTINFKRETNFPGSSANLHLTERFTRTAENSLEYRFTVDDPTMWAKPWTAVVPAVRSEDPIYEYACHEGNYALGSILRGARAAEKAEEAAKKDTK